MGGRPMDKPHYSEAIALSVEGARVGLVVCLACGSALLLSTLSDSLKIHEEWHESMRAG